MDPTPLASEIENLNTATLTGTHKIDVLSLDACLMGMLEDACEVKDSVDYLIESPVSFYPDGAFGSSASDLRLTVRQHLCCHAPRNG